MTFAVDAPTGRQAASFPIGSFSSILLRWSRQCVVRTSAIFFFFSLFYFPFHSIHVQKNTIMILSIAKTNRNRSSNLSHINTHSNTDIYKHGRTHITTYTYRQTHTHTHIYPIHTHTHTHTYTKNILSTMDISYLSMAANSEPC